MIGEQPEDGLLQEYPGSGHGPSRLDQVPRGQADHELGVAEPVLGGPNRVL